MDKIRFITKELSPLREELKQHRLYKLIKDVDDIKIFMEKHVFAVWDFMSLLKSLQQVITCVDFPWKPTQHGEISRFVNEIVLEEESDLNIEGNVQSHFEMYIDAMEEVGANTSKIKKLIRSLSSDESVLKQLKMFDFLERTELNFLRFTFKVIESKKTHLIASAFAFGREEIIPDMFLSVINKSSKQTHSRYPKFKYYLDRHIELDGDSHGPLANKMIIELCGNDSKKWNEVLAIAKHSLSQRLALWDGIAFRLELNNAKHLN